MELTIEQKNAIDKILTWYREDTQQTLTLGGYAGTGKTTLISFLRTLLKVNRVSFCAFTGKAAWVLKNKLKKHGAIYPNDTVSTIHRLIYKPVIDAETGEIERWERRDYIETDLIVVDEASMISQKIHFDLMSYGKKILYVGDHGQLPPISNNGFSLMIDPDIKLETVHRQAESNPILFLSMIVREEGKLPLRTGEMKNGSEIVYFVSKRKADIVMDNYKPSDNNIILVGSNRDRVSINSYIRHVILKIGENDPVVGDRVICLKNNYNTNVPIFNGLTGTIREIREKDEEEYDAVIEFDKQDIPFKGNISKFYFNNIYGKTDIPHNALTPRFDYAYAITVHKAQGSEFNDVVLFNRHRWRSETHDNFIKWLYTGITRAIQTLTIIT